MLWIVEATRLGETASIRTCVDAESWQRALEAVRRKRNEGTDLGSFTIELVSQGVRAMDATSRVRFSIEQAPPGANADLFAGTSIRPSAGPPRPRTPRQDLSKTRMGGPELASSSLTSAPPVPREDVGSPIPGMRHSICTRREQDPSTESPLVYREYTFALPAGTTAGDAERVLRTELARVQRSLETKAQGRYVNLAAFDHVFTARPARQPLATLAWKDWTNQVMVTFPGLSRGGVSTTSQRIATGRPPAAPSLSATEALGALNEASEAAETLAPHRPRQSSRHKVSSKVVSAPSRSERVNADALISSLFDVMHDLQFAKDALEGGSFCLEIAHEAIPHDVGFVHMYDVAKRNFVIACFRGSAPMEILASRVIESDSAIAGALRSKNPVLMVADRDPIPQLARHSRVTAPKSLIVAPMHYGSRILGAIEIVAPSDGEAFTSDEALAIGYIARQYAEFIASHGIVLDRARILAHAVG